MLKGNDLTVIDPSAEEHGYVLYNGKDFGNAAVFSKTTPSVPVTSVSTPASAGGVYDVRDSDGDKALTHLDWSLGAGQRTLDTEDASPYKFWESSNINIQIPGEISLLKSLTFASQANLSGKIFSTSGYFFVAKSTGAVYTSIDGASWVAASGTYATTNACFCTDGETVWAGSDATEAGSLKNITKFVLSTGTWTGSTFGSTGTTEKITGLAYNAGQLFAAVSSASLSRVAMVDMTTGVVATYVADSNQTTPIMFGSVTTINLISTANAVYWVVSQGYKTSVYKITYDPDAKAMYTEQYMELPSGFVCTCAIGYLSTIYLGGYYYTSYTNVGKGAVYQCSDGYASPLLEIGERPEDTADPTSIANDNRIKAICEANKDLYFATNVGVYRWDIDGAGWSHVGDLSNASAVATAWDASNYPFEVDSSETFFPTGWTEDVDTLTKTKVGHSLVFSGTGASTGHIHPTISNVNGCTFDVSFGITNAGTLRYTVIDGVKEARFLIGPNTVTIEKYVQSYSTQTVTAVVDKYGYSVTTPTMVFGTARDWTLLYPALYPVRSYDGAHYWQWNEWGTVTRATLTGNWYWPTDTLATGEYFQGTNTIEAACQGEKTVRCILKGNTATIQATGGVNISTTAIKANTGSDTMTVSITTGTALDRWDVKSTAAFYTGAEYETAIVRGVAFNLGMLMVSYSVTTGSAYYIGMMSTAYAASGWLTQSSTSLHCGSIVKNFYCIDVSHKPLPSGSTLTMTAYVDGKTYVLVPTTLSDTSTRFMLGVDGYSIQTKIGMTRSTSTYSTPVVKTINVFWNFKKGKVNNYILHCAAGAQSGRWRENPEEAISFLFTSADKKCTFEDVFNGTYVGTIKEIEFLKANYSIQEGYSGIVRLQVREEA